MYLLLSMPPISSAGSKPLYQYFRLSLDPHQSTFATIYLLVAMFSADNVGVYLSRPIDGLRYKEYPVPGNIRHCRDANKRYIEAATDERFQVHVHLLGGFDFMNSLAVCIRYHLEDRSEFREATLSEAGQSHQIDCVSRKIDGQFFDCGLTFGELAKGMRFLAFRLG